MIATDVVDLRLLDKLPDLWRLQMVKFVAVCGSKIGAHGSVMASDNDTASSSRLFLIYTVFDTKTNLVGGVLKRLGILVFANTADEDGRVWG